MKVIFSTCVSGNGHQTQAIALKQFLQEKGVDVCCNLTGKLFNKNLPEYFSKEFNIVQHDSFDFVFGKNSELIIYKTFLKNCVKFPKLLLSFIKICAKIKQQKPDIIVNFYEPLVGLSALLFPKIKYITFGHQHAMTLNMYPKIKGFYIQKTFLRLINYVTSIRAQKIALSYYEFTDSKVIACPPILRKETYAKSEEKQDFILVYLMNEDMVSRLVDNAALNPDLNIECFTKLTRKHLTISNVKLYNLDSKLFQEKMKICKAVVCSGGFETSSEAILHNKPLLMIPLPNHFEQYANCNDAQIHGFAKFNNRIDLSLIPESQKSNDKWFYSYKDVLDKVFCNL